MLRMNLMARVERTEEGKTCQKSMVLELTKQKHNQRWQKRGQQGMRRLGEREGGQKKRWAGRGVKAWRKILRLEELLVKFRQVKTRVEKA